MASKTIWVGIALVTIGSAGIACGGDDEGSGGSGTGTSTGTGTGTGSGTGSGTATGTGGSGGMGTGGMAATGGMGGMGTGGMGTGGAGGAGVDNCQKLCDASTDGGCPDAQCLTNCQAVESSAQSTGCTAELKTYYDCMFALPNICEAADCNDEVQALVSCTMN